jgi:pSer/pThr/pTyr-binding forkhead associated (FHA) protein
MSYLRVKQSGKLVKEIILDEAKSYMAGRKEGADIYMEAAKAISREHFVLKFDQAWTVEVLSRFGDIQFNNDRVRQFTLQEDSVFSIYPYDFEFIKKDPKIIASSQSMPMSADLSVMENQNAVAGDADEFEKTSVGGISFLPHIQFMDGNQFLQNLVVLSDQAEWVAGREASCDILINDHRASRKQFKITRNGNNYFIVDLGSVNGTSLNSHALAPNVATPIKSGDCIQVLDTVMLFELKNKDFDNELKKIQEANFLNPQQTNLPALHTGMSIAHTQATQNSLVHYTSEQAPLPSMYQNQNQGMAPYADQNALNYNYQQAPLPEGEYEDYDDPGTDRKKQIRLLLVAAVVLVLMFVGYSEFLTPKKSTKLANSSDPYSKLSPSELSLLKQSYEIATDYYFKKSFQLSYDEAQKIIKKLEDSGIQYKKTKFGLEVDDLLKNATIAIEAQREIDRHNKELDIKQKQDQIVSTVYNECEKKLGSNPEMSLAEYDECAREAVLINPEHPQHQSAVLKIQLHIEEKNRKAAEQKDYRERVAKLKSIYDRAHSTEKSGNFLQAVDEYKVVLRQDLPDPEELKDISQRKIASIQKMISSKSSKYVDDGEKFATQKKYKDAIDQFRKAQKVNPLDSSFEDRIASLRRELAKEIKPIWDESVIEEQYNQVECLDNKSCAIKKWKEILELDVKDGEYYSKALVKLKKYGAH